MASLFKLCSKRICRSINFLSDIEALPLPRVLKNRLVNMFNYDFRSTRFQEMLNDIFIPEWLETDEESIPLDVMKTLRQMGLDMWDWSRPAAISPDLYAELMITEPSYISFFMEDPTHFVLEYYTKVISDRPSYRLCRNCYLRDLDHGHACFWLDRDHAVYGVRNVLPEMQDVENWCANCVVTPLFSLFSTTSCRAKYGTHTRQRPELFWRFNNGSSDDDSDMDCFSSFRVFYPNLGPIA